MRSFASDRGGEQSSKEGIRSRLLAATSTPRRITWLSWFFFLVLSVALATLSGRTCLVLGIHDPTIEACACFLPAGLGVVALLALGLPGLLIVLLGELLAGLHGLPYQDPGMAALYSCSSVLRTFLITSLFIQRLRSPWKLRALVTAPDFCLFFIAVPLGIATVVNLIACAAGFIPAEKLLLAILIFTAGDSLGLLIFLPCMALVQGRAFLHSPDNAVKVFDIVTKKLRDRPPHGAAAHRFAAAVDWAVHKVSHSVTSPALENDAIRRVEFWARMKLYWDDFRRQALGG